MTDARASTTPPRRAQESAVSGDPYPSRCCDRAQVVAREDPVVWGDGSHARVLSELQLASYARDGFVLLDGVLDDDEVAALRHAAAAALGRDGIDPQTVIEEPDSAEVRSIFEIHRQNRAIGELARDARLLDVARDLLDDAIYLHQTRLNYKPGFAGKEFWWHSDFETWHVEDGMPRMRALSMSVLLTDNLITNGPLMLINGSHKHFVACLGETPDDHYKESLKKQEYGVPDHDSIATLSEQGGIHAAIAPAGSVIVFDCNILHGSASNISPCPRSNLFFVYNAMSNRCVEPFGGKPPRPQHIANREHVEPL